MKPRGGKPPHQKHYTIMNYIEIQNDLIRRYRIDLCDGTKCEDGDWGRTHAHPKQRRVCKWKQRNSLASTITLFHEVGHIENNNGITRRAEEEYYATTWAIDKLKEYGILFPMKDLFAYQRYVLVEVARGRRRGGRDYPEMNLYKYAGYDVSLEMVKRQIDPGWGID